MSTGQFIIDFEAERADSKDPMSQDQFSITRIEMDGRDITMQTTGQNDYALKKALEKICEHIASRRQKP